ncbi:TOTE conflict system archaeo-eukaryotic primase domain-containing protein [Paenibacillus gansuensis]|uniref:TOTE conflict system primase domain-containing protein n=1 Tax=Paenibacillus gansuensis TaxID=306542 RepID=A0ABW5PJW2_9BACL
MPKIDRQHALKHGHKSLAEFKDGYGIRYTTLQQRSREKFKQLYNIDYSRWGVVIGVDSEARYVTKQYVENFEEAKTHGMKSASKFPMSDASFNRHFTGLNPLAIFAYGDHSRYFGFDVDSKDQAPIHTLKIIRTLIDEGIPEDAIHVSFSGGKGYHVELFTDKHLHIDRWNELGAYVLHKSNLTGQPIEFRPNKGNGHAWKLPLTYHHKTGNFAAYCDLQTLEPFGVLESHDYLLRIQPVGIDDITPIITRAKAMQAEIQRKEADTKASQRKEQQKARQAVVITDARLFRTEDDKINTAHRLLTRGLVEQGTRWRATRELALYLFHIAGNDTETIRAQILEWTEKQIAAGLALTPIDQCAREIDAILEWIPTTDGLYSTVREISVTRAEIDWVTSVSNRYRRDLLWALLLRSKAYARNGTFYTSDRDIQKLLNKPRPMHFAVISKHRQGLVEKGYITADIPKNGYYEGLATTYRLLFEPVEEAEVIDSISFDDGLDGRALLRAIAAKMYEPKQLRAMKLA